MLEISAKDAKHPYGSEPVADPGYQSDGIYRYPIGTKAHARNAWSRINDPTNSGEYSPADLKKVKARIRAACRRFGVKLEGEDKATSALIDRECGIIHTETLARILSDAPSISIPDATKTHFFTAGRILSWFPEVNQNGYTFFREDCEPIAGTLMASTADLQHVKPGYGIRDSEFSGTNTTCGAIYDYVCTDKGIDIVVKVERSVAKSLGLEDTDFKPGTGEFAQYSQECEFSPFDSRFVVVSKSDPTQIKHVFSYDEGTELGLGISHVEKGKWDYSLYEGDPVYMAIKPVSFVGVGHVTKPADKTAVVQRLAASLLTADSPAGMDDGPNAPYNMTQPASPTSDDLNVYRDDLLNNPDLQTASVDKYHAEEDTGDFPDDYYAVSYMAPDHGNVKDGMPAVKKMRALRIKDNKGRLDRARLIAAYHAVMGLRGNIGVADSMPESVRQYAKNRIRHGLNETRHNMIKENSSIVESPEIAELNRQIDALRSQKAVSSEEHNAVLTERDEARAKIADLEDQVAQLTSSEAEAKAAVKKHEDEKLATSRLAELNSIAEYPEAERKDEKFGEFVTSLATISDIEFTNLKLQRQVAALSKVVSAATTQRSVSSFDGSPIPKYQPTEGERPNVGILY